MVYALYGLTPEEIAIVEGKGLMDIQNKDKFKGYISYMDILGFTSKIKSDDFKDKYRKLINYVGEQFYPDTKTSIYMVSDSIIVTSQDFEKVKVYSRKIYTWGMNNDFWIRGAIAQGDIETTDSDLIVRGNNNIIMPYLGDAYLSAWNLESKLNMAGIVIDRALVSDNPDLPLLENEDYIEYQEYLPKEGTEGKNRLLLPASNYEQRIVDTMYFEQMLLSHAEDIDKYVNTFSYYITLFLNAGDLGDVHIFLEKLCGQLGLQGRRLLIPNKVVIIFIAVIKGLFDHYRSPNNKYLSNGTLEFQVSTIIGALKKQGYLSIFTDYVLEYDKQRNTTLYRDIYLLRADISNFE